MDLIAHIDRACGDLGAKSGPSIGELVVAVAIQRACSLGPKRDLGEFLDASVARLSCLPGAAFSGQAFHRLATVLGLTLVSLAKIALGAHDSARAMMRSLSAIRATLVRTTTGGAGRRPTVMLAPELTAQQRRAVKVFALERWFPTLLSCMPARPVHA